MVGFPGKSFVWSLAWLDLYHLEGLKCRVFKTNSKTSNKTVQKWSLSVDQTDRPTPTGVCSSARWGSVLTTLMEVGSEKSAKIKKTPKNTAIMFRKFNRYQIRSHFDAWRVQEETLYPQIKKIDFWSKATWCGKTKSLQKILRSTNIYFLYSYSSVFLRAKSDHLMNESNASESGFGQLWTHLVITYSNYLRIIPLQSTVLK